MDNQLSPALGRHVSGFRDYLQAQHYSASSRAAYGRRINELASHMQATGMTIEQLDEERAERLLESLGWTTPRKKHTVHAVHTFVRYLIETGVVQSRRAPPCDSPRGRLRQDYIDYLRRQRGLRESSIYQAWWVANRFLQFLYGDADGDLAQLGTGDIVRYLHHLAAQSDRNKATISHLRNFLMFLFKGGRIKANLALGIPRKAQKYAARLPRHLTPAQVETLLDAVKTSSPAGRRDYAMVLLQARLGLRATEVVTIQIDDIDWRAGELIVRGKGQLHDRMPLPEDVGEALADYIRHDRASASRYLFVTQRAPRQPFRSAQILNWILLGAFKKTGLAPPAPYVGSHILRHSLAVEMTRRGASLAEIGDMLRHRARSSTMLYARLDIEGLRSIAQPWPVAGGAQ